jgi:gliding motility-associated lipoprotein GldH
MKKIFLRYIIFFILAVGCASGSTIKSFHNFSEQQWQRFENPLIDINIEHPGTFYNMWLELHYTSSFNRDNLPVTVIMYTPSGEIRSRDLILKFNAEDDKYNESGKLRVLLRKDFAFSERGNCKFEIENRSQKIETSGLISIGITIEKTQ